MARQKLRRLSLWQIDTYGLGFILSEAIYAVGAKGRLPPSLVEPNTVESTWPGT